MTASNTTILSSKAQPASRILESATSRSSARFEFARACLARKVSQITRYCDSVYQFEPLAHDHGELLEKIDCAKTERIASLDTLPQELKDEHSRSAVLLYGNVNYSLDIQALLSNLAQNMGRHSRIITIHYNPYLRWLYRIATFLGLRRGELPKTFLTKVSLTHLATLSDCAIVKSEPCVYSPWKLWGLGPLVNALLSNIPIVRELALTYVVVLKPVRPMNRAPSLSIVVPARNERGNIEAAARRLPRFRFANQDADVELLFVEGNSTDGTWEEIQRVEKAFPSMKIRSLKQTGKGKADAVRVGFREAKGELLTILDADLTMPPEDLPRFYEAYCKGQADFVNGSRLVYPMEGDAMKPLNWLGNLFFAKALSWSLGTRFGDSLCGTKLLTAVDYRRFIAWRKDFGDFDPFGDFELLFPAASLGLGSIDIPVYYRARTYGTTNILRFRHGLMLLRMTWIGWFKIKAGFWSPAKRVNGAPNA